MILRRSALAIPVALVLLAPGCARTSSPSFDPDAIPDAYPEATGALMTPGSTRAWQITADGDLYNGAWTLRIEPRSGDVQAAPPSRIAAEDRWLPVLHWKRRSGDVRWDFSAVAVPRLAPADSELIVSLDVQARNEGAASADADLELGLAPLAPGETWVAWDSPPQVPRWGGGAGRGLVHAWRAGADHDSVERVRWTLAPGQSRRERIVLPAYPTPEGVLRKFAARSHRAYEERARNEWRRTLARGAGFALGDPDVENAMRAATVVLLSCRERRGDRWVPIGGPFQYRDVWLRDGARAVAALAMIGHPRVARELADGLLLLQWPNGAFLSQRGQLDGTGQAQWAFGQAWLRPPGAGRDLSRFTDAAVAGAKWFVVQKELGQRLEGNFPLMLPFAEPRDGELVRAQLVGNDAWAIAGLRATSRLLSAAGREDEARSVAGAADDYRKAFAAALERTGSPDIPPSWQGPGRDWGNFAVAWPCEALPPGDPRVAAFARRVWAAGGGAGLTFYATPDSLHGYLGADLGVWAMLTGRRAQADSVLDAHLHWRTASGTAGEIFTRDGNFGSNFPPHPTSAAALVTLIRDAIVFDDDDTLRLTLGARDRWWRGAHVTRAPTRWGVLDLRFSRTGDRATWGWGGVPVWTTLTLPPGTVLAAAPAAPLTGVPGGRVVAAPPGTRTATVALAPERRP